MENKKEKNSKKKISKDKVDMSLDIEYGIGDDENVENAIQASSKIKKVKKELQECKKERQEYLLGWQRARADLINERKDFEKGNARIALAAREHLLEELLPALDSFDMAFANKEVWEKVDETWRTGIEYIHTHLLSVLSQNGFTIFNPEGEQFDPNSHESLETVSTTNKKDDGKIIDVLQKGYRRDDVIVRPAKVKVAVYKGSEK